MKHPRKLLSAATGASALLIALVAPASAATITFSGNGTNVVSGGAFTALSASVVFDDALLASQNKITITLNNTGPGATVPSDVLTAVFWDYSGPGSFT